jgi:hypothetical protein
MLSLVVLLKFLAVIPFVDIAYLAFWALDHHVACATSFPASLTTVAVNTKSVVMCAHCGDAGREVRCKRVALLRGMEMGDRSKHNGCARKDCGRVRN